MMRKKAFILITVRENNLSLNKMMQLKKASKINLKNKFHGSTMETTQRTFNFMNKYFI